MILQSDEEIHFAGYSTLHMHNMTELVSQTLQHQVNNMCNVFTSSNMILPIILCLAHQAFVLLGYWIIMDFLHLDCIFLQQARRTGNPQLPDAAQISPNVAVFQVWICLIYIYLMGKCSNKSWLCLRTCNLMLIQFFCSVQWQGTIYYRLCICIYCPCKY